MGRHEVDVYRNDRVYASPMEDEDGEEEFMDEDVEEEQAGEPEKEVEENFTQECQDYYERRERLKELEREKLRRSSNSGRREPEVKRKPLPYDNYGSFFGPSEPVIARRIIADARAREDASKVAARQSKEISEQHRISKGPSGVSKSAPQSSVVDKPTSVVGKPKQYASPNEASRRLQQLKEARDYSFLLNDEDPPVSPPRNDVQPAEKKNEGNDRPREANTFLKGGSAVAQRLPNPVKTGALKPPIGAKPMKANISPTLKGLPFQQKITNPAPKLSKVPERPPMAKAKLSTQSVLNSNSNKTVSGPGRPPQARSNGSAQGILNGKNSAISSSQGILNGKKPLSSSSAAQLKSLVASSSNGAKKQSISSIANKVTSGKAAPLRPTSAGGFERNPSQFSGGKSQASTSQQDLKRPSGVAARQGTSAGSHGQRRPAQLAATSKQVNKPPPRMLKRPRESESEDFFLDDEDGGGDVSSMIRKMFGYNPNKYRDLDDEDDRFMETNFHSIQMEEKRSARIAREEDDRELALIEEEERRERERAKKKRKQQR